MYSRKKFELLKYENEMMRIEKEISDMELMIFKTKIFHNVLKEPYPELQKEEEVEGEKEGDGEGEIVKKIEEKPKDPLAQKNSELRVIIKTMIKLFYHFLDERVASQENELLKEELEISNQLLEKYESELSRVTRLYNHEKQVKIFRGNLKEKMTEKMAALYKDNQTLKEFKVKFEERIQEEFEAKQTIHKNQVLKRESNYYKSLSDMYMGVLDRLGEIYSVEGVVHGKLLLKKWKSMFKRIIRERKPSDEEEREGIISIHYLLYLWNLAYSNIPPDTFNSRILKSRMLKEAIKDYGKSVERVFQKFMEGKEKITYDVDLTNLQMRLKLLFPTDLYPKEAKKYLYSGHSVLYLVKAVMMKHTQIEETKAKRSATATTEGDVKAEEETEGEESTKKADAKKEGEIDFITDEVPKQVKSVIGLFRTELHDYVVAKKLGSYCLRNIPEITSVLEGYFNFLSEPKRRTSEWKDMEKALFRCLYYLKNRISDQVKRAKEKKGGDRDSAIQRMKRKSVSEDDVPDKGVYYHHMKKKYDFILNENKNYMKAKEDLAKLKKSYEVLKKENGKIELSKKQLQSDFRVFQYTHDSAVKKSKSKIKVLEKELGKLKGEAEKMDEEREKEQIVLKAQIQTLEGKVGKIKEMEEKIMVLEKKVRNPTLNPEQLQALQMNTTIYTNLLKRFHYVYLMNLDEKKRKFLRESDMLKRDEGGMARFEKIKRTFQIKRELSEFKKSINQKVLDVNVVDLTDIKKMGEEETEGENEDEEIPEEKRKLLERKRFKDIIENEYPRKIIAIEDMIGKLKKEKIEKLMNEFFKLNLDCS